MRLFRESIKPDKETTSCVSCNGILRDELLNGEIFTTLLEAKALIEQWRKEYNQLRSHSSLNYEPPAPITIKPKIEILT